MVDYYSALKQTIARLESSDRASRIAFYDRAREGLLSRLRSIDPPMDESDIRKELSALEAAIRRLESEGRAGAAPPPRAPEPAAVPPAPRGLDAAPAEADIIPQEPIALRDDEVARPSPEKRWAFSPGLAVLVGAAVVALAGLAGYVFWPREKPPAAVQATVRPSAPPAVAQQQPAPRPKAKEAAVVDSDDLPYMLRRQLVYYRTSHPVGTIVIEKSQHFLYLVKPNLAAVRYTIGVGRDCLETVGLFSISRPPGPSSTASAAAVAQSNAGDKDKTIFFDGTKYRIRSPDTPSVVGRDSSLTGFQLLKTDFTDLYDRASSSTRVVVMN